jgi:hypothetical protein
VGTTTSIITSSLFGGDLVLEEMNSFGPQKRNMKQMYLIRFPHGGNNSTKKILVNTFS